MIQDAVVSLGIWSWFVFGVLLLAVEIFVPGTFVLWLGLAALATGLIALALDTAWQTQLLIFAVLSILFVVVWWRVAKRRRTADNDQPMLNRRAERHVGRVFVLDAPIMAGEGRVRIDDTTWRISGPDVPAGTHVRVTHAQGPLLVVERVEG